MDKYRAIPQGYMTVGEMAKRMGVTVRTLQYYHREGLLTPSLESEGGRRLYSGKDLIRLHQILSLKSLGFSLDDIRTRLMPLDTPVDVAEALSAQAGLIREKLAALSESLEEVEALMAEVLQMETVDFAKYADIIVNLQMKNEHYRLIKHLDDKTLDRLRSRFDQESAAALLDTFSRLSREAARLQKEGAPPGGALGQAFARDFWAMLMEFTDGDLTMLPKLMELGHLAGSGGEGAEEFIGAALDVYLTSLGMEPFEEENS